MNISNQKVVQISPYLVALIPQFIFESYEWIAFITVLIGSFAKLLMDDRRVFMRMFWIEVVVFSAVFFAFKERVFYLNDVFQNLGLSTVFLSLFFIIFNGLNIAILFYFGYNLSGLLFNKLKTSS